MAAFNCGTCLKPFKSRKTLYQHEKAFAGKCKRASATFQCNVCHAWYSSQFNLKRHITTIHKPTDVTNNITNNTTNNNTTNNNTTNNNTININVNIDNLVAYDSTTPLEIRDDVVRYILCNNKQVNDFIKGDTINSIQEVTACALTDVIKAIRGSDAAQRNAYIVSNDTSQVRVYTGDHWKQIRLKYYIQEMLQKASNGLRNVDNLQPCEQRAITRFADTHDTSRAEVNDNAKPCLYSYLMQSAPQLPMADEEAARQCACEACEPRPVWRVGSQLGLTEADAAELAERRACNLYDAFTSTFTRHAPRSLRKKGGEFARWVGGAWEPLATDAVLIPLAQEMGITLTPDTPMYDAIWTWLANLPDWQDGPVPGN